jgi:hypothetical protein
VSEVGAIDQLLYFGREGDGHKTTPSNLKAAD